MFIAQGSAPASPPLFICNLLANAIIIANASIVIVSAATSLTIVITT